MDSAAGMPCMYSLAVSLMDLERLIWVFLNVHCVRLADCTDPDLVVYMQCQSDLLRSRVPGRPAAICMYVYNVPDSEYGCIVLPKISRN